MTATSATREGLFDSLMESFRSARIEPWGVPNDTATSLRVAVLALPPDTWPGVLRAAVTRMAGARHLEDADPGRRAGALAYEIAMILYGARKLVLDEDDLHELLVTARHDCGHGGDTRPPFDLALARMRRFGYSPTLGAAIQVFARNLPDSRATKVRNLRRSAGILAVLERGPAPGATERDWGESVRTVLAETSGSERAAWERLVLQMRASELFSPPASWAREAGRLVDAIGYKQTERRLTEWWPDPRVADALQLRSGAAQVLKHFIWMLATLDPALGAQLACQLAYIRWTPTRNPLAVVKPASDFLTTVNATDEVALARQRLRMALDGAASPRVS